MNIKDRVAKHRQQIRRYVFATFEGRQEEVWAEICERSPEAAQTIIDALNHPSGTKMIKKLREIYQATKKKREEQGKNQKLAEPSELEGDATAFEKELGRALGHNLNNGSGMVLGIIESCPDDVSDEIIEQLMEENEEKKFDEFGTKCRLYQLLIQERTEKENKKLDWEKVKAVAKFAAIHSSWLFPD